MEAAVKAVFFDLDDTLIVYDSAVRAALRQTEEHFASLCPALGRGALGRAVWEAYRTRYGYGTAGYPRLARLGIDELRRELTRGAFCLLGIDAPDLEPLVAAYYQAAESRLIRARDDALATLARLKEIVRTGVITNGPSLLQRHKLEAAGLTGLIDWVVIDTEEGWPKPDGRLFARAAQRCGCAPRELMFVGNCPDADVGGAHAAGWTSVWFGDGPLPPGADFRVGRLAEVLRLAPLEAAFGDVTERMCAPTEE